jgi:hypothetical protein
MDYRLVKQFSNNAIDNFFNFFYKIADFVMVVVDMFWAFVDIWYQFFMIFINSWLYIYYLTLFAIDKLTMSKMFFRRRSSRHAMPGSAIYQTRIVLPVHPMYGRVEIPKPAQAAAQAVQSAAAISAKSVTGAMKKNVTKDAGESLVLFYTRLARGVSNFFKRIAAFFKELRPVRDETPEKKKSLIDEYMREYERKKKA